MIGAECVFVAKMANVCEEGSELTKKKGFRWSSEIIGNLVTFVVWTSVIIVPYITSRYKRG